MGQTLTTFNNPSTHVEWFWNSNSDPFSKSKSVEWHPYSDVENMIIEEAFQAKRTHAMLDNYHIEFAHNVQISNDDKNKQRPIKRMICNKDEKLLRLERFMTQPIAPNRPFAGSYGFISPFIREVVKDLNLTRENLPSKNRDVIPRIIEKAILGIIEEGQMLGKQREAEKIAYQLTEKKYATMKEVWKRCAYLYSLESFLYKKLNEIMRLVGSIEHEPVWRTKVHTLGPFCLLLWDNPFNSTMTKPGSIFYRGAHLPDDLIDSFKQDCLNKSKSLHSFQAFTSCTRNRNVAEKFGNVLFIMKTRIAFTVDISPLSKYPHEEEELLFPSVCFTIDRLELDKDKKKHLIYLTLQQRHNKADQHEITQNSAQSTQKNKAALLRSVLYSLLTLICFYFHGGTLLRLLLLGGFFYGIIHFSARVAALEVALGINNRGYRALTVLDTFFGAIYSTFYRTIYNRLHSVFVDVLAPVYVNLAARTGFLDYYGIGPIIGLIGLIGAFGIVPGLIYFSLDANTLADCHAHHGGNTFFEYYACLYFLGGLLLLGVAGGLYFAGDFIHDLPIYYYYYVVLVFDYIRGRRPNDHGYLYRDGHLYDWDEY